MGSVALTGPQGLQRDCVKGSITLAGVLLLLLSVSWSVYLLFCAI